MSDATNLSGLKKAFRGLPNVLPLEAAICTSSVRINSGSAVPFCTKPFLDPETEAAFAAADAEPKRQPGQWYHAPHLQPREGDGLDRSALQARVAELEAE
ncbi:hypothetical protein B0A55_07966 [Friedmanniomyces simplex]|uniref:Uncharacterized protein n=1 Tax=Friedmanniomyces simplex TaxID=329884 RepID=A0A4U0XH14_9PEZI|nr:hypothetical protein B0A55_07966 [Friedmanniomyces simplex]